VCAGRRAVRRGARAAGSRARPLCGAAGPRPRVRRRPRGSLFGGPLATPSTRSSTGTGRARAALGVARRARAVPPGAVVVSVRSPRPAARARLRPGRPARRRARAHGGRGRTAAPRRARRVRETPPRSGGRARAAPGTSRTRSRRARPSPEGRGPRDDVVTTGATADAAPRPPPGGRRRSWSSRSPGRSRFGAHAPPRALPLAVLLASASPRSPRGAPRAPAPSRAAAPAGPPTRRARLDALAHELVRDARSPRGLVPLAGSRARRRRPGPRPPGRGVRARRDDRGAHPEVRALAGSGSPGSSARAATSRERRAPPAAGFVTAWKIAGRSTTRGSAVRRGLPPEQRVDLAATMPASPRGGWRDLPPEAPCRVRAPRRDGAAGARGRRVRARGRGRPPRRAVRLWFGGSGARRCG